MRIGIDARTSGYTGLGRYTDNLIKNLLKIDGENQYIIFVQKKENEPKIQNIKSKIVKVDAPIYSFKEQINFLQAINKEKLDIIHFTHFNRPILYNRPSIVTIHDLIPIYFPGKKRKSVIERFAYRLVLKTALKKASKIIAVSGHTKKDLLKNFPFLDERKITVIYEGVETKFKNQNSKSKKSNCTSKVIKYRPYILYVGLQREHKNLLGLIKAFEKLKQNFNTISYRGQYRKNRLKLIIVGKSDSYYPEIPEAAKNSPFSKDIILTGYVSDEELIALYRYAEAFVFPSFYEGFGLPPLEAMAMGCPVVSSNASSLPEILGNAALYFDPYNINEMVLKIKQVLENQSLRKTLIEKGQKQIQKYSWQKMTEETLKVYNEINILRR